MRDYYREPDVSLGNVKRSSKKVFEPQLKWLVPSLSIIHHTLKCVFLCTRCKTVKNPRRYPFEICPVCGTQFVFYRGPLFMKMYVDRESFTANSLLNNTIPFKVDCSHIPNVEDYLLNVTVTNGWASMARSYDRENGIYNGFVLVEPPIGSSTNLILASAQLLNPVSAAFMEKYSRARKEKEESQMRIRKYKTVKKAPLTFSDLDEYGVWDTELDQARLFKEVLESTPYQFRKELDNYLWRLLGVAL